MIGFEIRYNEEIVRVAVKNGLLTISVQDVRGKGWILATANDAEEQSRKIWLDFVPLKKGDRIEIKMIEMGNCSEPKKSEAICVNQVQTAQELFEERERYLKEKKLI